MAYNIPRFELDPTGLNPSNRIIDEPYTLGSRDIRAISVNYGPFFKESLIVKDGATTLTYGTDYVAAELHQEASLKYGKEICSVILILNPNVSSTGTVTYQTLGGSYLNDSYAIANLYESVINDSRPISWDHVYNKPVTYPPTLHRHLLEDVYGFESVVDALERIKQAITLGQTDVILSIIDALMASYDCKTLPKVIPSPKLLTYDAMLFFLTNRFMISDYAIETIECTQLKGDTFDIQVRTRNIPNGAQILLVPYKSGPNITLLDVTPITVVIQNNYARQRFYLKTNNGIIDNYLYFGIKLNVNDEEFRAVTYRLKVVEQNKVNTAYARRQKIENTQYFFDYSGYYQNEASSIILETMME
jgi:hypothetical protein